MIKFKVFPGLDNWMAKESELYWEVRVYHTRNNMQRFWGKKGASAVVIPRTHTWLWEGKEVVLPKLGLVLFNRDELFGEIVVHEAVHMATWYLRRTRRSVNLGTDCDDREERLAYATGVCADQINRNFHRLGLWN